MSKLLRLAVLAASSLLPVYAQTITFTNTPKTGVQGRGYSFTFLTSPSCSGECSFTPGSYTPAPGLTGLDDTITGTPTTLGTFTFQLRAQLYPSGDSGTQTFSLRVVPQVTGPTSAPDGRINVPYNQQLLGSGGLGGPYTFTNATGLPPGLSLSNSGVLFGTPTAYGNFTLQVYVGENPSTNYDGQAAQIPSSVSVRIFPPALSLSATSRCRRPLERRVITSLWARAVVPAAMGTKLQAGTFRKA